MTRVRRHTERWAWRLGAALLASIALHVGPFALVRKLRQTTPLPFEMRVQTVEIGLEDAHPGAANPPGSTALPAELRPAAPTPPPPTAQREQHARAPRHTAPSQPLPDLDTLRELRTDLHEPELTMRHRRPTPLDPPPTQVVVTPPHEESHAFVPSLNGAAGDLAPLVPRGALITLLLRADHVREDPNAPAVRRLLGGIRDWNAMLGGSDLDPLRDLDTVLLAASQPFGTARQAPDWFAVVRGAGGSNDQLRRAVERMAAPPPDPDAPPAPTATGEHDPTLAPSPVNPPALDGGDDEDAGGRTALEPGARLPDGGAAAPHGGGARGGAGTIWQPAANGAEFVTLERYGARRSFVMLGDGMAAIALPGQVNRLLAAYARRAPALIPADDSRLALLLEADGVRNLVAFDTVNGPFPLPRRLALAVYQARDGAALTGGAELRSSWAYDDEATAARAAEMFEGSRRTWHRLIEENFSARGGLLGALRAFGAGVVGVNVPELEGAIDALTFRPEGTTLTIRANLTPAQVRAMLNLAAIAGGGGGP